MNLDPFAQWLRQHGTPDEISIYNPSSLQGLLLLARGQPMTDFHIEQGVSFARDSGLEEDDVSNLRRIGRLWLRFQSLGGSALAAAQTRIHTPHLPFEITISGAPQPAAVDAPKGQEEKKEQGKEDVVEFDDIIVRSPLRRAAPVLAGAMALVVVGGAAYRFFKRPEPAPVAVPSPAQETVPLGKLDLKARFPFGWEHLPASGRTHAAPGGAVKTALLYRGGSPVQPRHAAFVGVMPLAGDLVEGAAISDEALLAATRNGDMGLKLQLFEANTEYQPGGCEVTRIAGHRTGLCRGVASRKNGTTTLRTYLLVGGRRGILALFSAAPSVTDAAREEERIVASLEP